MNPKLSWLFTAILLVSLHRAETQKPLSTRLTSCIESATTNVRATSPEASHLWSAFRQGLSERGWIEGRNVITEYRQAEGQVERFPSLAAELVRLKVDLIVAGPLVTRAAKEATSTDTHYHGARIPIRSATDSLPAWRDLVGNITGLSRLAPGLTGKQLELLKEIVPELSGCRFRDFNRGPGNAQTLRRSGTCRRGLRGRASIPRHPKSQRY